MANSSGKRLITEVLQRAKGAEALLILLRSQDSSLPRPLFLRIPDDSCNNINGGLPSIQNSHVCQREAKNEINYTTDLRFHLFCFQARAKPTDILYYT